MRRTLSSNETGWLALHSPNVPDVRSKTFSVWASSAKHGQVHDSRPGRDCIGAWTTDRNCGHFRFVWLSQMTIRAITSCIKVSMVRTRMFVNWSSHMSPVPACLASFEGQQQIRNAMSNVPRLTLLEELLHSIISIPSCSNVNINAKMAVNFHPCHVC